jgi:hypothetical protein
LSQWPGQFVEGQLLPDVDPRQGGPPDTEDGEHIGGFMKIEMAFSEHVSSLEFHRSGTPRRH